MKQTAFGAAINAVIGAADSAANGAASVEET